MITLPKLVYYQVHVTAFQMSDVAYVLLVIAYFGTQSVCWYTFNEGREWLNFLFVSSCVIYFSLLCNCLHIPICIACFWTFITEHHLLINSHSLNFKIGIHACSTKSKVLFDLWLQPKIVYTVGHCILLNTEMNQ